jgi:hypothetical protein
MWFTSGVLYDEDAKVDVGTGNWVQTLGSGLTSADAAIIQFQYWDGSKLLNQAAMADRTPFIHGGAGQTPQWNNGGTLQAATDNTYVVYHYFGSPRVSGKGLFARPHNAIFAAPGSFATAVAARPSSLIWPDYAELKHLYSVVFRVETSWGASPSHLCRIASVQDFRLVAGSPTAAVNPTAHSSLSGLSGPDVHPDTSITNTATGGALDSSVEIDVGLALERLAEFGHTQPWGTATAYRQYNDVVRTGVVFSCLTAHTAGTFNTDWSTGKWYANGPIVVDTTYSITTSSGSSLPAYRGRDLTIPVIGSGGVPILAHITPFGGSGSNDGQIYRLVGTSSTATVTYQHSDADYGMILQGDCELGYGRMLSVQWVQTLLRYVEISRTNVGGI